MGEQLDFLEQLMEPKVPVILPSYAQLRLPDDQLTPVIKEHSIIKHIKFEHIVGMLTTSMRKRFKLTYIDLYAGAGKCTIPDETGIHLGSPLLAMDVKYPFDRYVCVELDKGLHAALEYRAKAFFPNLNKAILNLDANKDIVQILKHVPNYEPGKSLGFCFVDPFNTKNLDFRTLHTVAQWLRTDFLILIPTHMDLHRNRAHYCKPDVKTLDIFLGSESWRKDCAIGSANYNKFGVYIADQFGKRMAEMKYYYSGLNQYAVVKQNSTSGSPLYHLGYFSRHPLGQKFWDTTLAQTERQLTLV